MCQVLDPRPYACDLRPFRGEAWGPSSCRAPCTAKQGSMLAHILPVHISCPSRAWNAMLVSDSGGTSLVFHALRAQRIWKRLGLGSGLV